MSHSVFAPLEPALDRGGAPGAVRAAMLALFGRLGDRAHEGAEVPLPNADDDGGQRARAQARRALRQRATAAYDTVEGGGAAALDVALEVVLEELEAIARRAHHREETLKAISLYAPDPWVRRMAQQSLARPDCGAPPPGFLVGNALDAAEVSAMATRYIG